MNYQITDKPDPHIERRKNLLSEFGNEIKPLMKPIPFTAAIAVIVVGIQIYTSYLTSHLNYFQITLLAFCFGAFFNHALYVIIHEATHSLVFRTPFLNRMVLLLCDFPLLLPGAMPFRKYHLLHHSYFGQIEADADLVSHQEAKLVGNSSVKKVIWFLFLGISQSLRPNKLAKIKFWDQWIFVNLFTQICVVFLIFNFSGLKGLLYLLLSSIFGLGLHPLGGRWIAEHFITKSGQETYSYYGPLNYLALNVGHHVEHHDFMNIPWLYLPKLKKIAPHSYQNLSFYTSYVVVLRNFIFNPNVTLHSRIVRESQKTYETK